jgi:hypothetical protein
MTDEGLVRLTVVAGAGLFAVVAGLVARRGTTVRRHRVSLPGMGPGLFLFSSTTCAACVVMRERLAPVPDVVEISYEDGSFPPAVGRVPALARLDESGSGWIAYGKIGEKRMHRWLAGGP